MAETIAPTYANAHILLRFNGYFGTAGNAVDRWSTGMRFGIVGADVPYDASSLQAFVNAAKTAASTFHTTSSSATGTTCFLESVTGARIGTDGKYFPKTQLTIISSLSPTTGAGTSVHPWDTASVISLRTSNPRGYASNGRVYWPALSLAVVSTTGRVDNGVLGARVNNFKTFADALNVAASAYAVNMHLQVVSGVAPGTAARVTTIRADQRLDSIERRENNQPALYSTATLA